MFCEGNLSELQDSLCILRRLLEIGEEILLGISHIPEFIQSEGKKLLDSCIVRTICEDLTSKYRARTIRTILIELRCSGEVAILIVRRYLRCITDP